MKKRKEVMWFANKMEEILRENDYKDHWSGCSIKWLLNRLNQETGELKRALNNVYPNPEMNSKKRIENAIKEAVDVANFAMMIADNIKDRYIDKQSKGVQK